MQRILRIEVESLPVHDTEDFEAAVAAKPDHAEAHYQLGMALVNEGNLNGAATEFETYLKLAPSGPNAATAKGILGTIKK